MDELLEGAGTLSSRMSPAEQFTVDYSINFRFGIQALPAEPRIVKKQSHVVNKVERVDGQDIPDGDYELIANDGRYSEYIHLRKRQHTWEVLPYW